MKRLEWKGLWSRLLHWRGWRKLFWVHPALIVALAAVSAVGLVWVFVRGLETALFAYPLYCLSAYALAVLTVRLPGLVKRSREAIRRHPRVEKAIRDEELHFRLGLYVEQLVNFVYGVFKTVSGVVVGSAWIGADGLYNLIQAIIQLFQILRRRQKLPVERQWRVYRSCGWLTLVMHLTLTGLIYQMTQMDRFEDYPGFQIFATAAFVFYKLINALIDVARDRKHKAPIDSAVRYLDLSQSFYNVFSLQVAMLHAFGQSGTDYKLVNILTGTAVCLLTVGMGVYMIRRANKALKQ